MNKKLDIKTLEAQIAELAKAERITKEVLGSLSRDLLEHYADSGDVSLINSLLGEVEGKFILTPLNWRVAVQYFRTFVPHGSNWEELKDAVIKGGKRSPFVFGKRSGNALKRIGDSLAEWLADEANNIWTFSDTVKVEAEPADYFKGIVKAIEKALDEDKGAFTQEEVLSAVFESGITAVDMLNMLNKAADKPVVAQVAAA